MIKTIAIIILSVTFFGVLFFILVRNALKKKLDILVEEEKKKKELSRTNKRASLVGALWCCVLPRWRDDSSSPLEVDDASKTTLSFLPTSKP